MNALFINPLNCTQKMLISNQDIRKATGIYKYKIAGKIIASLLMQVLKIHKINRIYELIEAKKNQDFFDALLGELDIKVSFHQADIKRIPNEGAFVIVSNHPLGAMDGIIMTKLVSLVRSDFKVMGNFLIKRVSPMADFVIPVNPFKKRKAIFSSVPGFRKSLKHLENGGALGIFPAGVVSNKDKQTGVIQDIQWDNAVIKLIQKANVPVIPMYFHAKNSRSFYTIGSMHPLLQTALLPREMLKKRINPIELRFGKMISANQISEYSNTEECGNFIRNKVYMLKSYYDNEKKLFGFNKLPTFRHDKKFVDIISETSKEKILSEVNNLRANKTDLLFSTKQYEIFFALTPDIPNILREIGRLREITFRAIGEGSNKSFDLDEFDNHYQHLFLWENEIEKIIGAYRLGLGQKIYPHLKIDGFYTSSLFHFDKKIQPSFLKTIEMGRAFIIPEYQQKPWPLFHLWKGIVHVCIRNPSHMYLMGPVSISDKFSDFSKSLMIKFIRSHYNDSNLAQFIHPKKEFNDSLNDFKIDDLLQTLDGDLNKLDKIIDEIEPDLRLPVLIKKYFKQNAKVIAFNVDPKFNNAIDALMHIKISEIPEETLKPLMNKS